jgi:hypothetical protein
MGNSVYSIRRGKPFFSLEYKVQQKVVDKLVGVVCSTTWTEAKQSKAIGRNKKKSGSSTQDKRDLGKAQDGQSDETDTTLPQELGRKQKRVSCYEEQSDER